MQRIFVLSLLFAAVSFDYTLIAQISIIDKDKKAVELSVELLHKAIIEADSTALFDLTTKELTYGHSSGAVENRALFIANLLSGKSDFAEITVSDQDITIKGEAAWVRFNMAAKLMNAGTTTPITLKILYVWIRENGNWKLLARQAVK